jgi:tetratricopeptide (TPR) repeat protein
MVLEQMVELATSLIDDNFTASAEALLRLSLQLAEHDDHLISRVQLLLLITSQISGNEPLAKEAIDWLQTHGRDEDLHQLHEIRGLHQEHLANFTSALNEYQTALTFPEINAPVCRYHMARCQISLGNVDATILLLQECFSEAPQFQERFLQDPAFVLYRGDPAFSPLISSLKGSMM